MEVFCLVFKAISIIFFFFEAVNVYRKQESYVDFCHLTTYTQCKPNLFNLSLIQKKMEELKKKKKRKKKGKKLKTQKLSQHDNLVCKRNITIHI